MNTFAQQAIAYRESGLCPMPLYRKDDPKQSSGNKQPIVPGWERLTMPTNEQIFKWWPDGIKRNLGIVCGPVSGNLVVVDFDDMEGWRHWAVTTHPPQTYVVLTAKGIHCYYRTRELPSGNRKMICGDVRGKGGQVVAPPSVHLTGKVYEVGAHIPIARIDCIEDLQLPFVIKHDDTQDKRDAERARTQATKDAAVRGVLRRLSDERNQGNRNNLLYWCAHRLNEAGMKALEITDALSGIARAIGLEDEEIGKTINSALQIRSKQNG